MAFVNSPLTGEFPAQMTNNAENVSIWWRHHVFRMKLSKQHLDKQDSNKDHR